MARQRLGQHFLHGDSWQRRILGTLPLDADQVWVEIGPGHGEMTRLLAAPDRHVIAIEADPRLAAGLQERLRAHPDELPSLEIVARDVLEVNIGDLTGDKFHVYGNLPYYITSPILHQLFGYADRIASIHIVIQLEVAERIAARPCHREYGYLSVACQFYGTPKIEFRIPPGAFRPPPKVTSALLSMTLPGERASLGVSDDAGFLKFVQLCFGQKRKTLRNNLLTIASDSKIHATLAACGLRPDARAEQLSLALFAGLFARLG